jgi:23S rRNA pseudouridine1911/1915/1917 synthase
MSNSEEIEKGQDSEDLYEHHRIEADPGQNPLRVDKFLTNRLLNASRNRIQNAAKAGSIMVNGISVKSNYKVKAADVVTVVLAYPPRDKTLQPENIPLNIVFEDDSIVIVNKEPGMVVHPGYNNHEGTLVNALMYHFNSLPTMEGNDETRPGLVHRIDKDTSGLLLISKDDVGMTFLAKQFFDHSINRTYWALVWGDVEEEEGTITSYLGRSLKDRKIMYSYEDENEGKLAITHYKVLERYHYATLVECKLETGRTHQIRVHMRSIGHPIFNDQTYGGDRLVSGPQYTKYKQFIDNCFTIMPRQALHAKTLGFIHPETKKKVLFDSQLPDDFQGVIDKWNHYVKYSLNDL